MSQILELPACVRCEPAPHFDNEGLLVLPPYGRSEAFAEDLESTAADVEPVRGREAMRRCAPQR